MKNKGLASASPTVLPAAEPREAERTRLWDSEPPPKQADTELGRRIQQQTGAPSVMVNRILRRVAEQALQSEVGEGEKPN